MIVLWGAGPKGLRFPLGRRAFTLAITLGGLRFGRAPPSGHHDVQLAGCVRAESIFRTLLEIQS